MKLMRSRFRLISLLLACAFLAAAAFCSASVLNQAGIAVPAVQQFLPVTVSVSPEAFPGETPGLPPQASPAPEQTVSAAPEGASEKNVPPETDIPADSEYNIFGL